MPIPPPTPFGVYEASLGGPDGTVLRGTSLSDADAVARLQRGDDVVVCGDDGWANRVKAEQLGNTAFGACDWDKAHDDKGRWRALPHFHPSSGTPRVHIFYERRPTKHASRGDA